MSHALRGGLARLELTTKVTLAVLATASGVYTYLGVRDLLDGTANLVFFGAIIYSVAVSVGIYAFWSYLMRFLPHVHQGANRSLLFLAMAVGSAMIIAMSSWLNAAALAGSAALEQHLAGTVESYQAKLDQAHQNALAAQSLLPDIQLASARFSRLAREEQRSGALTGTSGSGTVVQLLRQMSKELTSLAEQVAASRERVQSLFNQGGRHLARMRKLVSASGPIAARSDAFAEEAVVLTGVIAALEQTSIAPAVKRTAEDLVRTFIAPTADGRTADLVARQNKIVDRVEKAVAAQSKALAAAADEILKRPPVVPHRFEPLSTPEAVLRYAGDFLPSWAGAISIDLMPGVLILILCGVQAAIRREEGGELDGHAITADDMMRAMRLYRAMVEERETVVAPPTTANAGNGEPAAVEPGERAGSKTAAERQGLQGQREAKPQAVASSEAERQGANNIATLTAPGTARSSKEA